MATRAIGSVTSTTTGTAIEAKTKLLLHDNTNIRWTKDEIKGWINSAQAEIVLFKPNACVAKVPVSMVAGTFQNLGDVYSNIIQILDVVSATSGNTVSAITNINRDVLDQAIPNWHSVTQTSVPVHYCYNPVDPKNLWVYPPNNGTGSLAVIAAVEPTPLTDITSTLGLDAIYESIVIDYVLYRAWGKDSEHAGNAARSKQHYEAFMNALKGKFNAETSLAAAAEFADTKTQTQSN